MKSAAFLADFGAIVHNATIEHGCLREPPAADDYARSLGALVLERLRDEDFTIVRTGGRRKRAAKAGRT